MTRKWDVLGVINDRIYEELNIIEEESKKSLQKGSVKTRSIKIAVEMNFLRKEIENRDGSIRFAERLRQQAEERQEYLETRLREEKAKRESD